MAKASRISGTSVAQGSANRLRSLCTPAERTLLDLSDGAGLSKATHAQVQESLKRAREMRDKWRGLVGKQSRAAKRAPRAVAEANARSHAKADLFDAAVKRFETHLKSLAPAAVGGKPVAVRKSPPKRARIAGNRTARAGLRAEMERKAAAINAVVAAKAAARPAAGSGVVKKSGAAKAGTAKSVVAKPVGAKTVVAAVTPAGVAVKSTAPVGNAALKKASRKARRPAAPAAAQAVRFDAAKQRSARTAAKSARLRVDGLATRKGSHLIAAGKRSQARRDKRR